MRVEDVTVRVWLLGHLLQMGWGNIVMSNNTIKLYGTGINKTGASCTHD